MSSTEKTRKLRRHSNGWDGEILAQFPIGKSCTIFQQARFNKPKETSLF